MTRFPTIDYSSHPAYSAFATDYLYDNRLIEDLVRDIDRRFADFGALRQPSIADVADFVDAVNANAKKIIRHAAEVQAPIVACEWLGSSVEWAVDDMHYECIRLVLRDRGMDDASLSAERRAQLDKLRKDGMYLADVDDRDFRNVQRLALRFAPELRRRVLEMPSERAVYSPSRISPLGRAITRLLSRAGVLEVLTHFKQTRMAIMGTGLEYSRPGQLWHADLYSDLGLADSPLKYFHTDQADHLPKAMIYATTVANDNGPTGIIRGSNTWERSEFLFRAHKGLDRVTIGRYGKYVQGSVYRAVARSAELRRIFMQLPSAFQGSSHFGDDVVPQSPTADQLLSQEQDFLSATQGQVLVFDGARTLHRGSLVREGERVAMQVAFKNLNDRKIREHLNGGSPLSKALRRIRTLAVMSVRN